VLTLQRVVLKIRVLEPQLDIVYTLTPLLVADSR
jgi:hypothetical protein